MSYLRIAVLMAVVALGLGWYVTRPQPLPEAALTGLIGDPEGGALVFAAAGCASCHLGEDSELLSGGKRFTSDFGTFVAPNISSDEVHGIGAWTDVELASAIIAGVGRDGQHLYPAFPYSSYNKISQQDLADLIAYLRTLPASDQPNAPHELGFPFNIRASLGVWKALFVNESWIMNSEDDANVVRGRYLVEALGHCAECHTSRNALGGLDYANWMAGAPNPSGDGRIPNITPAALSWSAGEIAEYLKSGFTPDFDSAGGSMAAVVRNTSKLSDADRAAIAAYLKAVPAISDEES